MGKAPLRTVPPCLQSGLLPGVLSHHNELYRTLRLGGRSRSLLRAPPQDGTISGLQSGKKKPRTNQGHLGPPSGHSPAPSFPPQAAGVGLGVKGVALGEEVLGPSHMFNASSSPPPREELNSVINHLLERDSPVHACPAAVEAQAGVPTVQRGLKKRQKNQTQTDRSTQSH